MLAGIEDGFDNGWALIRADVGSLFLFLCLFASVVRLALSGPQKDEK